MLSIFDYQFMIHAFLAGLAIAIIAPVIGTFLVARRYSLIADSLAHVSLAGVGAGLLFSLSPTLGALGVAVLAALLIEYLRSRGKLSGEVALAMFLSSGLAIAVILISVAHSVNVDLMSYLFGSITTVRSTDLIVILALAALVLGTIIALYKELVYATFDDEQARVSGLPTRLLGQILVVLAAVTVVVSLRIVGALLIGALMVIPVAAAMQLARSLLSTIFYAIGFGLFAVIVGLFVAYYFDLPAGATIVVASLASFFFAALLRRVK